MKKIAFIALILALLLVSPGCLEKTKKLGCCVKENATDDGKCYLFNMSNDKFIDMYSDTLDDCNSTQEGYCNVTVGTGTTLIPICSDDTLTQCIKQDCTVMVCGDFKYSPRIAPGVTTQDDLEEMVPADTEEETVQGLYNAQCRFYPMDSKLKARMKTTDSLINRFRFGVGGSFDEYDLYKDYFPISDKYCAINPLGEVDRYMNYIAGDMSTFDPIEGIDKNCVNDSDILPPLTFGNSSKYFTRVLPEKSSYKYADFITANRNATGEGNLQSETSATTVLFANLFSGNGEYYKKLDKWWYRKTLASIYSDMFYENASRAPFECDAQKADCLSGVCKTDFYSRGVSLSGPSGSEEAFPSDCNLATVRGMQMVICAPTIEYSPPSKTGGVPKLTYAKTSMRPWEFSIATETFNKKHLLLDYPNDDDARFTREFGFWDCVIEQYEDDYNDAHSKCGLDWLWGRWQRFSDNYIYIEEGESCGSGCTFGPVFSDEDHRVSHADDGQHKFIINQRFGSFEQITRLPSDYGFEKNTTTGNWDPYMDSQMSYPPAGQIVFFGDKDVEFTFPETGTSYDNIIGYAVMDPGELYKTYFSDACSIDFSYSGYEQPTSPEQETFACQAGCQNACFGGALSQACKDYCTYGSTSPKPCSPGQNPDATASDDFIIVDISDQSNYEALMKAFTPIYNETANYYAGLDWEDNCGKWIDSSDIFMASMSWIPEYKKWLEYDGEDKGEKRIFSSPAHEFFKTYNLYDQSLPEEAYLADLCQLKKISATHVGVGIDEDDYGGITYRLLQPKYVYLLRKTEGSDGTDRIGSCELDPSTGLPKIRTYGWCEPCTVSTAAYQKVTTTKNPYLPMLEYNIESGKTTKLCEFNEINKGSWISAGPGGASSYVITTSYNASCYAPHITDINDYSGIDTTKVGSPRTYPQATIMKERMGNYLKSSVMPILDLTNKSNWDLSAPYVTGIDFSTIITPAGVPGLSISTDKAFPEFDFERLLGNSGAITIVVDSIETSTVSSEDISRILNRTSIIRSYCWRCLTAVDIQAPDNKTFETKLTQLFSDSRMRLNVDIVTTSYSTSKLSYNSTATDEENAQAVLDNMISYGTISLKKGGTPTMITQFFVPEKDPWDEGNYDTLFRKIIEDQGDLVQAGIIGVIYAPASKSVYGLDEALVDSSSGIGVKTPKFCALEKASSLLASTAQRAQFAKSTALSSVNCTKCTSLDSALGKCNTTCDNGVNCTLPSGVTSESGYMCPEGTVVEECRLCNATFGTFLCNKTYVNGTVEQLAYSSVDVKSDIYGDVLGGLERPDKCCFRDSAGSNYTYVKKLVANAVNAPIVFPKNADPNADCGMASSSDISTSGQFCGVKLPVQDYDIECVFVEIPIVQVTATLPDYKVVTANTIINPVIPFSP